MFTALDYGEPRTGTFETPYGHVTRVSLEVFLSHFLPTLPAGFDLDARLVSLQRRRKLWKQLVTKGDRLWGYGRRDPSQYGTSGAYLPLRSCFQRLSTAFAGRNEHLTFVDNNESISDYFDCSEDALPDAFVKLAGPADIDGLNPWTSIAVSGVYQLDSCQGSLEHNSAKLARCMARCIMNDPSRRFTYGFTAEDTKMSFWYCDRTHFVASGSFDFITDYASLFRFLISCAYAEPLSLGFDPTVTPVKSSEGAIQYNIAVCPGTPQEQVFRTTDVLFDAGSRYVVGRGTRVWKAKKVDPKTGNAVGESVVLKDAWVDKHREREGDIDARIRESASTLCEADRRRLDQALLSVVCHGDVTVHGAADCTRPWTEGRLSTGERCAKRVVHENPAPPQVVQAHYRIVFQEVGQPLQEESSLPVVFGALAEVCEGLSLLHRCGWVHGDVSANNILLCNGAAKISDLEYARRQDEVCEHDRIGTSFFMSVEVHAHRYLFNRTHWSEPPCPEMVGTLGLANLEGCRSIKVPSAAEWTMVNEAWDKLADTPFRYNPLHDLESVWWIGAFFLMTFTVVSEGPVDNEHRRAREAQIEKQHGSFRRLFFDSDERNLAMTSQGRFPRELQSLHHSLRKIGSAVEEARNVLVDAYHWAEKDMGGREFGVRTRTYDALRRKFSHAAKRLRSRNINTEPLDV